MNHEEQLNLALEEALRWGTAGRLELTERVGAALPECSTAQVNALCDEARAAKDALHEILWNVYDAMTQTFPAKEGLEAIARERWSWISEENLRHAISQGMYYAWHG